MIEGVSKALWVVMATVFVTVVLVARGQKVPCYFVFGDDLFDNGNNNDLNTTAMVNYLPYSIDFPQGPTGRFSNGRNIPDVIAEGAGFNASIPPYVGGSRAKAHIGLNYASGGGGIRDETGQNLGERFSFRNQIENHISVLLNAKGPPTTELSECLYTISFGSNDYLNNYFLQPNTISSRLFNSRPFAAELIMQYGVYLTQLHGLGARKVALFGIGTIGCTPAMIAIHDKDGACAEEVNQAVMIFNDGLRNLVGYLNNRLLDGVKFTYVNIFSETVESFPNRDLLHLCVMDSMMPSPSRLLEGEFEPMGEPSEGLFINKSPGSLVPFRITETVHPEGHMPSPNGNVASTTSKTKLSTPSLQSDGQEIQNSTTTPPSLTVAHTQPLGAWASPMKISEMFNVTFSKPVFPSSTNLEHSVVPYMDSWPPLSTFTSKGKGKRSQDAKSSSLNYKVVTSRVTTANPSSRISDKPVEYPWAARMRSKCNLHKVTTPTYLPNGTPKVMIPPSVLLKGLENQKEFIVGQFQHCKTPSGGLVHGIATRIWGKKCRIYTKELGSSSFLFHIPDESTRTWVLQRGVWYVDDCLMFVSPWDPSGSISIPEIKTMPIWLTLKNIPFQLYSFTCIDWIASGIGEPMLTSKPWLDPTSMGEAKILVEVKLDRPFPQKVALEDNEGTISMVDISYAWLPTTCSHCGRLGHKASRCLGVDDSNPAIVVSRTSQVTSTTKDVLKIAQESDLTNVSLPTHSHIVTTDHLEDSQGGLMVMATLPTTNQLLQHDATIVSSDVEKKATSPTSDKAFTLQNSVPSDTSTITSYTHVSTRLSTSILASLKDQPIVSTISQVTNAMDSLNSNIALVEKHSPEQVKGGNSFSILQNVDDTDQVTESIDLVYTSKDVTQVTPMNSHSNNQEELDCVEPLPPHEDISYMSQRGRHVKPSSKIKDSDWITVIGKGKRGRGGRGAPS